MFLYSACPALVFLAIYGVNHSLTITLAKTYCYCCCYLHALIRAYIDKVLLELLEKAFKSNKYYVPGFCYICTQLQTAIVSETDGDILLNGNTEIEHVSRLLNLDRNK